MSDVPDEILREILSRLSVPPLLRFRCVSKSWKGLIDNNQFIKEHLNHSQKTNSNLKIILRNCHLYSADFDLLNETNQADFKELTHPLKTPFGGNEILGSCDGLLVLINDEDDDTILWNPTIRKFHELPFTRIECPKRFTTFDCVTHGFGYDVVSDDYKLIRIAQWYDMYDDEYHSEVKVYSLKSDSWRRIPDFPYYLKFSWRHGQFASGALHWIVRRKVKSDSDRLVAAFDLGTEEYRLVLLPKFPGISSDYFLALGVLGGCLSIICEYEYHVDIWVLKEYGVQESWSILFTYDKCHDRCNFFTLIAYSNCGTKVLLRLDERVLMWYDLDKKSTDFTVQMLLENIYSLHTCLPSLVLLNNGTSDFDLFTKKKLEMKGEKRRYGRRKDFLDKGSRRGIIPVGNLSLAGEPQGL